MGRKILVPTTVAAALRARHTLVAMSLAAMLVLALAAPVAAQAETTNRTQTVAKDKDASGDQYQLVQGDAQQAEMSSCATDADEVATFTTKDTTFGPFRIAGESFDVLYAAQLDRGNGPFRVAVTKDGKTVTETATITESPAEGTLEVDDEGPGSFSLDVEADGLDFAITVCEAGRADDGGDGGAANAGGGENGQDDLEDLSCDELLVLFRGESSSGQQYGDAAVFAGSRVRAQVEVCLEREIVQGTAADEDLPDTGGLSLLALAVLGFVSAAAGLSVIRGGRR